MKKIIIFLLLVSIFPGKHIAAEEVNDTKEITKDGRVDVEVSSTLLYYSSHSKISTWWKDKYVDGQYSYCLKFEDLIKDTADHTLKDPLDVYSEETWNKISLFAMYGERRFELTKDKNYRIAAQVLIHEAIYNKGSIMKLYDYSSGSKKNYSVESYKKEIIDLYNIHMIIPSFDFESTDFVVGETYTFEDTNNIVSEYYIENMSENLNITTDGNLVSITINSAGESSFAFVSDNYEEVGEVMFWSSSKFQDLITVTYYTPSRVDFNISSRPVIGNVEVSKLDSETREYLSGAEFSLQRLIDGQYVEIDTFIVNETYLYEGLEAGSYKLVELNAPEGYFLENSEYSFEIVTDNETVKIEVLNTKTLPKTGLKMADFTLLTVIVSIFSFLRLKAHIY